MACAVASGVSNGDDSPVEPPRTQFAWNGDAALAYQVFGEGSMPLLYIEGWSGNVEVAWESPYLSAFLRGLGTIGRVVFMDRRGRGCSERFSPSAVPPFELMADDIEWVNPGDPDDNPNAGTFKGKEAVLGWFGGLAATRDYTTFEPREFIAQNDKVVSLVYAEATVRDTGRAFANHEAHVSTFREGKLARFQIYLDTAAAAAAHRVE